jgi:hypothetical protein
MDHLYRDFPVEVTHVGATRQLMEAVPVVRYDVILFAWSGPHDDELSSVLELLHRVRKNGFLLLQLGTDARQQVIDELCQPCLPFDHLKGFFLVEEYRLASRGRNRRGGARCQHRQPEGR